MAKSRDYWAKRFEALEASLNKKGEAFNQDLNRQYVLAMENIEKEILKWYSRLAANNDISLAEARKLMNSKELKEFKWNVFEYIKYGEKNAIDAQWMKELENASARVHISKLEAMRLHIRQHIEALYGKQLEELTELGKTIYTEGYYHTAYEIQKGFNLGWTLFPIDENRITKVISKPWAVDGQNFSSRLWGNKTQLINSLYTQLTQAIVRGDSPETAIRALTHEFGVSRSKAARLVMTESAFFASASQKDCFNDLDVEQYEVLATLDSRTSEICQSLDGTVHEMKDHEVGSTAPPFHPYCRTTTIPHFEDDYGERVARDKDGEVFYVPSDMKYKEWESKYIKAAA
jgi:SPP1 gp7 family putative phage head morphogenesis protein